VFVPRSAYCDHQFGPFTEDVPGSREISDPNELLQAIERQRTMPVMPIGRSLMSGIPNSSIEDRVEIALDLLARELRETREELTTAREEMTAARKDAVRFEERSMTLITSIGDVLKDFNARLEQHGERIEQHKRDAEACWSSLANHKTALLSLDRSAVDHKSHIEKLLFLAMHGARAPIAAGAVDQAGATGARGGSPVVVELQRDERGHATGALHLPIGGSMTIERNASGAIIGVKPRAVDDAPSA